MSDRENVDETASDLLGSAAQCAASDLLDLRRNLLVSPNSQGTCRKTNRAAVNIATRTDDQPRASSTLRPGRLLKSAAGHPVAINSPRTPEQVIWILQRLTREDGLACLRPSLGPAQGHQVK